MKKRINTNNILNLNADFHSIDTWYNKITRDAFNHILGSMQDVVSSHASINVHSLLRTLKEQYEREH